MSMCKKSATKFIAEFSILNQEKRSALPLACDSLRPRRRRACSWGWRSWGTLCWPPRPWSSAPTVSSFPEWGRVRLKSRASAVILNFYTAVIFLFAFSIKWSRLGQVILIRLVQSYLKFLKKVSAWKHLFELLCRTINPNCPALYKS